MRGGSRNGAGRPGHKRKAEQSLPLDVRRLACKGFLKPGSGCTWQWTNGHGERIGRIGISVTGDAEKINLSYCWTPYGSEPIDAKCSIQIEQTPCTYGGSRPWFRCPDCWRRCAVVYFGAKGGRYACRHCANIAYAAQSDDRTGRLWRKQRKIENRLSDGAGDWNGWQKPKGMHQSTFDQLRQTLHEIERQKNQEFFLAARRLMGQIG